MKIIIKVIAFQICLIAGLLSGNVVLAQGNITIDFNANCTSSTACNIFKSTSACSKDNTYLKLKTSHGSPRFVVFADIKDVRLDAGTSGGEGFFLEYNFTAGNNYKVEVTVGGPQGISSTLLKVDLANGLSSKDDGCNLGDQPNVSDVFKLIESNDYTSMKQKIFTVYNKPTKNYSQLWIRSTPRSSSATGVEIAWIRITETVNSPAVSGNSICCEQTICSGSSPTLLEQVSGITLTTTTTPTFQWQASTDGTNFSNVPSNGTSANYSPSNLTQTTWFQRVVNGVKSAPVKITIIPASLTFGNGSLYPSDNTIKAVNDITINNTLFGSESQVIFKAGKSITIVPCNCANNYTRIDPNISFIISDPCPSSSAGRVSTIDDEIEQIIGQAEVTVYPNPTKDKLFIELAFQAIENTPIELYDAFGKLENVSAIKEINSHLYEVDLQGKPTGLYFMRILTQQGWITKKVVVSK